MPIYCWTDENSGKEVEILRSFDESSSEPTKEEAEQAGITEEPKWKKIIGRNINMIKGPSWGAGKGYH